MKVPPLRKKSRDWSKVDPESLTVALGWNRIYDDAPGGAMQAINEGDSDMSKGLGAALKVAMRNSKADQELIDTISDLADEIGSLAEELGATPDSEDSGEDAADPMDAGEGMAGKALSLEAMAERVRHAFTEPQAAAQAAQAPTYAPAAQSWAWVREVYPTYAILDMDGASYRATYTIEGDVITPSPRSEWQKVESVWIGAKVYAPGGAVKAIDPGNPYLIHGPGIVRGGRDLVGDTFTKATDHGFARSPIGMPVYYDHAQRGIKSQIGTVTGYEDEGDYIDFTIELDRRHKYINEVLQLEDQKALGLSSGAVGHLVVRQQGELKRWIVGELSLTPTPAEPRTNTTRMQTQAKAEPAKAIDLIAPAAHEVAPIIIMINKPKKGNNQS